MKLNQIIKANHDDFIAMADAVGTALDYVINIGERLTDAKNQVDDFPEWLEETHDFKRIQGNKYIRVAKHKAQARAIMQQHGELSINDIQKLLPKTSEDPVVVEEDSDSLAYVGSKPGTVDKDDWHTPVKYIELAREVMGSIDLDPFSSVHSNKIINATRVLTLADNAFTREWSDSSTNNFIGSIAILTSNFGRAVEKFLAGASLVAVHVIVVPMNNATDTGWFDRMTNAANMVAFTRGRIAFENSDGKATSGNTRGQVFFYFGNHVTRLIGEGRRWL